MVPCTHSSLKAVTHVTSCRVHGSYWRDGPNECAPAVEFEEVAFTFAIWKIQLEVVDTLSVSTAVWLAKDRTVPSFTTDPLPTWVAHAVRLCRVAAALATAVDVIETGTSGDVTNVTTETGFVETVASTFFYHAVLAAFRVAATTSPA